MIRLSVLIPTVGRPTLQRAIDSAAGADEILVDFNQDGDLGYAARTRMMEEASGTHLLFMDDDDVYAPGAIELLRSLAEDQPDRVHICQMRYGGAGGVLWHTRIVKHGNIGTPMLLVPNVRGKLGVWEPHDGDGSGAGDYVFAASTIALQGPPVWVERVICLVRPE